MNYGDVESQLAELAKALNDAGKSTLLNTNELDMLKKVLVLDRKVTDEAMTKAIKEDPESLDNLIERLDSAEDEEELQNNLDTLQGDTLAAVVLKSPSITKKMSEDQISKFADYISKKVSKNLPKLGDLEWLEQNLPLVHSLKDGAFTGKLDHRLIYKLKNNFVFKEIEAASPEKSKEEDAPKVPESVSSMIKRILWRK